MLLVRRARPFPLIALTAGDPTGLHYPLGLPIAVRWPPRRAPCAGRRLVVGVTQHTGSNRSTAGRVRVAARALGRRQKFDARARELPLAKRAASKPNPLQQMVPGTNSELIQSGFSC